VCASAWQEGAYYTGVTADKELKTFKMNMPGPNKIKQILGVQCGGSFYTIERNGDGKLEMTNFVPFLMGAEPQQFSCKAGSFLFSPSNSKMYGQYGVVHGFVSGPTVTSSVPEVKNPDEVTLVQKKSYKAREVKIELPGGEEITGYSGLRLGCCIHKCVNMDALFEEQADGTLASVEKGQKELYDLLGVDGLELTLEFGKNGIAEKPTFVFLHIMAQHPKMNGGKKMMLFATTARSPHILQPCLPGGKSLKDILELPWSYLNRQRVDAVAGLVTFGRVVNDLSVSKWKKDVVRGIPDREVEMAQAIAKVHNERELDQLTYLLSCVKTRVSMVDGEWTTSGLQIDMTDKAHKIMKKIMKSKNPEDDSEDDSEDDDSEDDSEDNSEDDSEDDSDDLDDDPKSGANNVPTPCTPVKTQAVKRKRIDSPVVSEDKEDELRSCSESECSESECSESDGP
jgi:hypothetical protein